MNSLFVDTSALFASAVVTDPDHERATATLGDPGMRMVTTDVVLTELWALLSERRDKPDAERVVEAVVTSGVEIESVSKGDLLRAMEIGVEFADQPFSLVDRTCFAVMHRLGLRRVATFDHHFAVYRFGPGKRRSFEIAR